MKRVRKTSVTAGRRLHGVEAYHSIEHGKNPCARSYIFGSLVKQVLVFLGNYWPFRLIGFLIILLMSKKGILLLITEKDK